MAKKKPNASANVDIQDFNISLLGFSIPVRFKHIVFDGQNIEVSGIFKLEKDKPVIEISLGVNRTQDDITHTYFHELFHALCFCLGVHNCQLSHDLEEILADNLGRVMKENYRFEF